MTKEARQYHTKLFVDEEASLKDFLYKWCKNN